MAMPYNIPGRVRDLELLVLAAQNWQLQSRPFASPLALTTVTNADITATPITITPGTWEISGMLQFLFAATTTVTGITMYISKTSATSPPTTTVGVPVDGEITIARNYFGTALSAVASTNAELVCPLYRVTVTANTTLYLIARANFGTSTCSAYGHYSARRIG